MISHKQINPYFDRYGETVEVYAKVKHGENDLSNPEWDWRLAGKIKVVFSNTTDSYQVNEPAAEYTTKEQNVYLRKQQEPPTQNVRIKRVQRAGDVFELRGATDHGSHIQFRARLVRDEEPVEKYSTEPYNG
jgi:hypothetical protein